MSQANSTFSRPRATSPSASAMVLPFSRLMIRARSSRLFKINSRRRKMISARRDRGVARQSAAAALAAATARSTSSRPAKPTLAMTSPVAGLLTTPWRSELAGSSLPLIQRETIAVSDVSRTLIGFPTFPCLSVRSLAGRFRGCGLSGAVSLLLNPCDGFRRQFVKGRDARDQMLFPSIFNFVVTDAVERLHEKHHRGNAGAGDFSRIVQRAGGHTMGATNGLANGFFAESYQMRMKWFRRNVPDARPLDAAAFLGGELNALLLGFVIHPGEHLGIKIALIERRLAAAYDRGDNAGKGFHAAHRAHCVWVTFGNGPNFESEPGSSGQGIAARSHRRGTRVGFLTQKGHSVALDTFGTEDSSQGEVHALKDRALLDMHLKIGRGVLALQGCVADRADVDAAGGQCLFETLAGRVGTVTIGFNGMRAGKCRGAEKAATEARAFFIGPVNKANGDGRFAVVLSIDSLEHGIGGEDAETTVKPAAVGN